MADTSAGNPEPINLSDPINLIEDRLPPRNGTALFYRRWIPPQTQAVVHIVHGMADHGGRYDRLARRLAASGFEVWAADQRGFGNTACPENDPARGGLLGHSADSGATEAIAGDLREINRLIKAAHPGKKIFMLGHSWGSFLAQYFVEEFSDEIDGCVLSGTRGPGGFEMRLGAALFSLIAGRNPRRPSKLSRAISDGPFNRPFRPNRTPFDWISRDAAEVDAYIADPKCGQLCSSGFYREMILLLGRIHEKRNMAKIRKDLPVYIYAGGADPVGQNGAGPTALAAAYRALGITGVELKLYPEARHELHSETNRDEMADNLIAWLTQFVF